MLLQLALDMIDVEQGLELAGLVEKTIDIIEIGTPFIIRDGMAPVRRFCAAFPKLSILADIKIMDAGRHEARIAIEAGASILTVLGVADDITIRAAIEEAHKASRKVMVDMICVKEMEKRTKEVDALGADYICAHTAYDIQRTGRDPLEELKLIKANLTHAQAAVAGGVTLDNIAAIAAERPAIVVIGGGITGQREPAATAEKMKEIIEMVGKA